MVIRMDVTIPPLTGDKVRKGYVYLPDDYNNDPLKRYPVMYMFDGHNVFFDSDATYGKSWGMTSYMNWTTWLRHLPVLHPKECCPQHLSIHQSCGGKLLLRYCKSG